MAASCACSYGYATIATFPLLIVQVYAIDYMSHRLTILIKKIVVDSTPNKVCPRLLYTGTTFSVVSTPIITGVSGTLIWCCMHTTLKCEHYP